MNANPVVDVQKSIYVCFHLKTERPSRACLERLSRQGVECVSEGPAFQAFGVISEPEDSLDRLASDPEVLMVERTEPPSSK